jgi:hypothetical protein
MPSAGFSDAPLEVVLSFIPRHKPTHALQQMKPRCDLVGRKQALDATFEPVGLVEAVAPARSFYLNTY